MKILKEYQNLFGDQKIYLSPWKDKSILILNTKEKEDVVTRIQKIVTKEDRGIYRFLEASMIEVEIRDNEFEIPEHLLRHTETGDLRWIYKDNNLLLVGQNKLI